MVQSLYILGFGGILVAEAPFYSSHLDLIDWMDPRAPGPTYAYVEGQGRCVCFLRVPRQRLTYLHTGLSGDTDTERDKQTLK